MTDSLVPIRGKKERASCPGPSPGFFPKSPPLRPCLG